MKNKIYLTLLFGAIALFTSACGGGGGGGGVTGGTNPPVSLSLTGVAATGLAIPNASVTAKCQSGTGSATTIASGAYSVSITGGLLPCMLEVINPADGAKIHSVATGSGTSAVANITPLTELVTSRLLGQDSTIYFAGLTAANLAIKITTAGISAAQADVVSALTGTVDTTVISNFISTPMVAATLASPASGDLQDKLLDALRLKLTTVQLGTVTTALASNQTADAIKQTVINLTTTPTTQPVAKAGTAQSVVAGSTVTLDASTSTAAPGKTLTYAWKLTSKPAGSAATLAAPTTAKPTFVADLPGAYVASVIVNDGLQTSTAESVTVTATSTGATVTTSADLSPTSVSAIALQTDGKIVVGGYDTTAGTRTKFSLNRLNSIDLLDTTFGVSGIVTTGVGSGNAYLYDVAIQKDGKILALGQATLPNGNNGLAIVRYLSNGTVDTSFGLQGIALNSAPTGMETFYVMHKFTVQSDGKILAVGSGWIQKPEGYVNHVVVYRFNMDGSLDPSFSQTGYFVYENSGASDIRVGPDGLIYLLGGGKGKNGIVTPAISRILPSGGLDLTFGVAGIVQPTSLFVKEGNAVAIQTDGKFVIVGRSRIDPDTVGVMSMRLNNDGTLDMSFGKNGVGFYDINPYSEFANSVSMDGSGRILLSGVLPSDSIGFAHSGFLMRLLSNGDVDTTYGVNGFITTNGTCGGLKLSTEGHAFLIVGDRKIVRIGN